MENVVVFGLRIACNAFNLYSTTNLEPYFHNIVLSCCSHRRTEKDVYV